MIDENIRQQFLDWVDSVLDRPIPPQVVAFNFNLYDAPATWDVQLIGAPSFDPANPDWACDELFDSGQPFFELPHLRNDESWEEGLARAIDLVREYLRTGRNAGRLRSAKGVGVGFVDGELEIVSGVHRT